MQIDLVVENADVEPSMTRTHHDLLLLSFAADGVLRYPWGDEMRLQVRFVCDLFNDVLELVKWLAFSGREIMERAAV